MIIPEISISLASSLSILMQTIAPSIKAYAVNNSGCLCNVNGVNHLPVFLANTEAANGTFRCIVVHWHISISQEYTEIFFQIQHVTECFFQFRCSYFCFMLFQVRKQSIYQRFYNHLTLSKSFFR